MRGEQLALLLFCFRVSLYCLCMRWVWKQLTNSKSICSACILPIQINHIGIFSKLFLQLMYKTFFLMWGVIVKYSFLPPSILIDEVRIAMR